MKTYGNSLSLASKYCTVNAPTINACKMSLVSLQRSIPQVSCYHFPATNHVSSIVTDLPESETCLKMWDLTINETAFFCANDEHRTLDGLS